MKYLFEIDGNSKTGKQVLPLLKGLSEAGNGINNLSADEIEDRALAAMMKISAKSGIASQKRVLRKLSIKCK